MWYLIVSIPDLCLLSYLNNINFLDINIQNGDENSLRLSSLSENTHNDCTAWFILIKFYILLDFSLTVKAAPHECVIRTGQPRA